MTSVSSNRITIALLGQPNSGKSTLFNGLTGARQRVGNWPGKTVEKKEGHFDRNGIRYRVTDLPGTYSLSANSEEEIITRDYIASGEADVVCILADSSQLSRSLFMLADYAGINCLLCFIKPYGYSKFPRQNNRCRQNRRKAWNTCSSLCGGRYKALRCLL